MKKQFLTVLAAMVIVAGGYSVANAAPANDKAKAVPAIEQNKKMMPGEKPHCVNPENCGKHEHFGPGPKLSPEERAQRKAAFEKRLNLTEEQKTLAEANRKKDREKMEPLMQKMKANRDEFIKVKNDTTLSESDKNKKMEKLRKERKELQIKADKYHEENIKHFEALLDDNQKIEFAKIRAEKKAEREKFMKEMKQNPNHPCPFQGQKPVK